MWQWNWLTGGQRGFTGNFSGTLLLIDGREVQNLLAAEGDKDPRHFRIPEESLSLDAEGRYARMVGSDAPARLARICLRRQDILGWFHGCV